MSFRNVVVALAGKEDEKNLIRKAVGLSRELKATLSALHVNHPGAGAPHMKMDAPEATTETAIRDLFRNAGHEDEADAIDVRIVEGDPYHEKIAEATADADLVFIGHSQRNAFVTALISSVDEKVANIARCPVVIVPKS